MHRVLFPGESKHFDRQPLGSVPLTLTITPTPSIRLGMRAGAICHADVDVRPHPLAVSPRPLTHFTGGRHGSFSRSAPETYFIKGRKLIGTCGPAADVDFTALPCSASPTFRSSPSLERPGTQQSARQGHPSKLAVSKRSSSESSAGCTDAG